jgi:uncharacterized membrane protein YjfL (UPF0719 family)
MNTAFDYVFLVLFLFVDLIVGIVIIYFIVKVFSSVFIKSTQLEFLQENNLASTILLVAIVISTAILCSNTIMTVHQNLRLADRIPQESKVSFVLQTSALGLLQIILSVLITLFIAFISTKLFDVLTKGLDEYREMREKNNTAVGLLLAGIVIALTIFVGFPLSALVAVLIPLPQQVLPL